MTEKDPSGSLAQAASSLPGGADNAPLSRRRLPSWQGAKSRKGSFWLIGTVRGPSTWGYRKHPFVRPTFAQLARPQ